MSFEFLPAWGIYYPMRRCGYIVLLLATFGALLPGRSATQSQARLILSAEIARPGETIEAGVLLKMAPGWHTYWVNPGDSGGASEIAWDLPTGVTAGEIQWPVPEKYTVSDLTTYVYHDEVLLVVPLKLSGTLAPGKVELNAKISWLECATLCLPGNARVSASLEIGAGTKPSTEAPRFEEWRKRMPRLGRPPAVRAVWEGGVSGDTRAVVIEWTGPGTANDTDFFPLAGKGFDVQAATERLPADPGTRRLRKQVKKLEGDWPTELAGVLVETLKPTPVAYAVTLKISEAAPGAAVISAPGEASASTGRPVHQSLGLMLAFAFLGGLILNVMPCVLPVIALKVVAFVKQAQDSPATVRKHGLIYGTGVLVSFLVLAGFVIFVQQGGRLASWGMQFQSPEFLVVMTTIVTLVALNLFGVFEITLGGRTMGAVAELASRHGSAGAFFNGVLATTLATPCTAPYLGSAVGFAFTQPSSVVILMFLAIGLGLAAPYVLLSFVPGLARFLPRPGRWMEKFKVAMGFPMLAAAVWLLSLLSRHYGNAGVLWVGLFLLLVALAAWLWGEFVQRGRLRRWIGAMVSLLLLLAGYFFPLESQLQWRSPRAPNRTTPELKRPGAIAWEAWSPAAVNRARAEGRPILVDFTADWCVTCQANKKTSLEIASVETKLKAINAVALLGDYTLQDDAITAELKRWGRAGVPLVLVYPRDKSKGPIVLPELLTPSIVLNALDQGAQ